MFAQVREHNTFSVTSSYMKYSGGYLFRTEQGSTVTILYSTVSGPGRSVYGLWAASETLLGSSLNFISSTLRGIQYGFTAGCTENSLATGSRFIDVLFGELYTCRSKQSRVVSTYLNYYQDVTNSAVTAEGNVDLWFVRVSNWQVGSKALNVGGYGYELVNGAKAVYPTGPSTLFPFNGSFGFGPSGTLGDIGITDYSPALVVSKEDLNSLSPKCATSLLQGTSVCL